MTSAAPPRRRTLRNAAFSVLGKAQAAVFSYVVIRLLLDVLTLEQYGLYSLLFIGVMVNLSMLFQLGAPNLMTRYIPAHFSNRNGAAIFDIFRRVFRVQLVVGLAAALLGFLLAPQIALWINFPDDAQIIRVFTLAALLYLLTEVYHLLFGAIFRQQTVFAVTIAYNTLRLLLLAGVWWHYRSFMAVVIAEGVALLGCLVFYALALRRSEVVKTADSSAAPDWPRMKKYAGLCYVNEIGVSLLSVATDFFLVSGILGGVAAGYYGLANRISDLAQKVLPAKMLGPVIQPLFFSEYGQNRERVEFGFRLLMKSILLPTVAVGLWLAVMSREVIVYLFDPRYEDAALLVAVMALFLPSAMMRMPLGLVLQNAERIDLLIYAKITGVLKIVAGVLLIPVYGIMTMVWITGLSVLTQNMIVSFFVRRVTGARPDWWGNLRVWINGVLAALPLYFFREHFASLPGVMLSALLFALLFLGLSLLNRAFTKEERNFINSKLPKPWWRF